MYNCIYVAIQVLPWRLKTHGTAVVHVKKVKGLQGNKTATDYNKDPEREDPGSTAHQMHSPLECL